ncbi:COP9 signalosome complex subunit 3 [Anthonomus grandis grandis]|uniref:COP9 signalosome complex subunit 3 n=1 Tax=Anthonomus grandis grandis TaxID=2921223 RepID=UPI0021661819|nr:COP9 signalosome complex subunit 3 [Anthonomus grandis grandis]
MASALELFVNTVRNLSSHGNLRELYDTIGKSNDILLKNIQHLDNVLETLDVQQHSLGVLAVLIAKFSSSNVTLPDNRFMQAQDFFLNCNIEQVKKAPDSFAEFCHLFTNYLVEQKTPMKGISLLKHAIIRLKYLSENQLTSIHADFCQLCLLAKCFKPALQILDVDIVSICQELNHTNPNSPQFDAKYFLLYYYYGGKIYLAVRNLERALYFFEVALTTPAHAVSHIMLEAYKKFILVSLLLHGKVEQIPKYASKVVMRFIKPLSQPYNDLANAFFSNNSVELNNIIQKHTEVFSRDHNMGLVKQVSSVLYKKNIQRLTKTFLTLSLSDVASRVGLPGPQDAEKHILNMIENGQIYATINQKDGMVVFSDEPDKYCGPGVLKTLEEELSFCMDLNNRILMMDEEIQVNLHYVKKSASLQEEDQPSKSTYAM